ncbi:MAG: carbohydrate-binding protein [Bacillota bacterium]
MFLDWLRGQARTNRPAKPMDDNKRDTDRRRGRVRPRGDFFEEFAEEIIDDDTRLYRPLRQDYEFAGSVSPAKIDTEKRKRTTARTATATRRTGTAKSRSRSEASMSVSDVGGGVFVSPMPITKGDRVTLKYNGLLSKSGATSIFAHVGYGPVDWMDVQDIPMTKEPDGTWTVNIEMAEDQISPLNVCFRDSAYNWDNNYGNNWSFQLHAGRS